jgi:3D (Asp-Asp-Asp) domain-containing protein
LAKGVLMLQPEIKTSWLNNLIPQALAGVDDSSGGSGSGGEAGGGGGSSGNETTCCVTDGSGNVVTDGSGNGITFGGPQAPTFGEGSTAANTGGGSNGICLNGASNYPTCFIAPLSCPSGLPAIVTTNYRCYAPAYTRQGHNSDQYFSPVYTAWQVSPITTIAQCGISTNGGRPIYIETASSQSCPLVVAPPITAGPVDAICAPTHYSCSIGTSVNNVANATQWDWQCDGYNGGVAATCSELVGAIPPPVPPPTPAPTVDLTAAPTTIDNGDSSVLTWVVTNATNCNASGGTWSGAKSTTGGTDSVSPVVNTTYTLSCTGIGGTTVDTVTVNLPDGSIGAAGCTIVVGNTTCPAGVVWTSSNFLGQPQVLQGTTTFSNAPASTVTNFIPVTPTTNVFTLRDAGGTFIDVATASVGCDASSVWVPSLAICAPLPTITITADPNVIRSGTPATLDIEIDALYDLSCTLNDGGGVRNLTHTGAATPTPYSEVTRNLTSAQIVTIECTSVLYPPVTGSGEARVNVVPTIQEI